MQRRWKMKKNVVIDLSIKNMEMKAEEKNYFQGLEFMIF